MGYVTTSPQGLQASQITNKTKTATNTAATVTITNPGFSILIVNYDASASLYVDFTGAIATSSAFTIKPGAGLNFESNPPVTAFSILSSVASSSYGLLVN